jgi:hypothetical protein
MEPTWCYHQQTVMQQSHPLPTITPEVQRPHLGGIRKPSNIRMKYQHKIYLLPHSYISHSHRRMESYASSHGNLSPNLLLTENDTILHNLTLKTASGTLRPYPMYLCDIISDLRKLPIINWKLNLIYKQTYVQYTLIYTLPYTGLSSDFCRLFSVTPDDFLFLVLNSEKLIITRTS